jgi:triosephosphate isomerase
MRKKIVAGNWKMNTLLKDGMELAKAVEKLEKEKTSDALVIIAPPYTHLSRIKDLIQGVRLSAQNCASEEGGAYTGEISPDMLKSVGVEYVIIGHSERRAYYGEDDALLNKKTKLALSKGLKPIFCCGEVLEEREGGKLYDVIREQVSVGLKNLSKEEMAEVVIAYEPVWAIGTGVVASPEQAQEMHKFIRDLLVELFDAEVAENMTILYGGSCKPSNAAELFANPDVDGGLIGGASLKAEDFLGIVNAY